MENILKKYRDLKGINQKALAEELQPVCPGIDASLISKIEHGICCPIDAVNKYVEKAFANQFAESFVRDGSIPQSSEKDLLNNQFYNSIYEVVKRGSRDYPISRTRLAAITGVSDRFVRNGIAEMRRNGIPIMSSSSNYGYWLAEEMGEDYREFRAEMMSRANDIWGTVRAMDNYYATKGQIQLEL